YDAAILKRLLPPFQKHVSLAVPFEFAVSIEGKGVRRSELIHLHGMVDDEIYLLKRINLLRISSHPFDDVPHCREIHDRRDPGEVLPQHSRWSKSNFPCGLLCRRSRRHCADVLRGDSVAILEAQEVFQHDLQRNGQIRYSSRAHSLRLLE